MKRRDRADGPASRLVWLARDAVRLIGLPEFYQVNRALDFTPKGSFINQSRE